MSKKKDKISIKNGRLKVTTYVGGNKVGYIMTAEALIELLAESTGKIKRTENG